MNSRKLQNFHEQLDDFGRPVGASSEAAILPPAGSLPAPAAEPKADTAPGRGAKVISGDSQKRQLSPHFYTALRIATPIVLLVIWQLAASSGVFDERTLAPPSKIADTSWELIQNGALPEAITVSLRRAATGFLLGAAVAVLMGAFVGLSRIGDALIDPMMQMVRTLPLFGLVPLFILWFGIGESPKLLLVALGVVIPLYLNLVAALRSIDPELYEVADTLRLSAWERWRHLIIPGALPGTLVGLRQSLGIAWLALIVAEQINASAGLGFMINNARDFLRTDIIIVGLLAYAALGLLTDALVRMMEKRALRWRDEAVNA